MMNFNYECSGNLQSKAACLASMVVEFLSLIRQNGISCPVKDCTITFVAFAGLLAFDIEKLNATEFHPFLIKIDTALFPAHLEPLMCPCVRIVCARVGPPRGIVA